MDDTRAQKLEERLAHLEKVADDLSDVVADQAREIVALRRKVALLMERAAEQEADSGGSVALADQKPPHW